MQMTTITFVPTMSSNTTKSKRNVLTIEEQLAKLDSGTARLERLAAIRKRWSDARIPTYHEYIGPYMRHIGKELSPKERSNLTAIWSGQPLGNFEFYAQILEGMTALMLEREGAKKVEPQTH